MSGVKSTRIAGALLPHVNQGEVVDILLPRADIATATNLGAAPSDRVASKYAKGSLQHALSIARHPDTSPDVLAKYAKDTRVSVRQALIANPSTPYESMVNLANWAHNKNDESMGKAIMRLNAKDALSVLVNNKITERGLYGDRQYPYSSLGAKFVASGDVSVIKDAFKLSMPNLQEGIITAAYEAANSPISITELFELDSTHLDPVLARFIEGQESCTVELASLLARSEMRSRYMRVKSFIFLADGAAEKLLESKNPTVHRIAALSGVRGPLLDGTIAKSNLTMLGSLVRDVGKEFSKDQELALIRQVLRFTTEEFDSNAGSVLSEILSSATHRIPSKILLGAMRATGGNSVSLWLSGQFPSNHPRKGEIKELVSNPGFAFVVPHFRGYGYSGQTPQPNNRDDVRNVLVRTMDIAMSKPWADEYAVALGEELIPNLPNSTRTASWVAKRFHASFGSHEGCWETALTMAADWSGDIEELITTTLLFNEIEPPEMVEPTLPEQLTL